MTNDLKPYENITRVFWIKLEVTDVPRNGRQILGEIRDVVSGERCRIWSLGDIISFILPFIQSMGMRVHWFWQFVCWLNKHGKT